MFSTTFKCLPSPDLEMENSQLHPFEFALLRTVSDPVQLHGTIQNYVKSNFTIDANFCFTFLAPGAPSNVSFPDVSLTTARIIWDVPDEPNGEILAYRVTYHLESKGSAYNFSREFPPSDRTYRLVNIIFWCVLTVFFHTLNCVYTSIV